MTIANAIRTTIHRIGITAQKQTAKFITSVKLASGIFQARLINLRIKLLRFWWNSILIPHVRLVKAHVEAAIILYGADPDLFDFSDSESEALVHDSEDRWDYLHTER